MADLERRSDFALRDARRHILCAARKRDDYAIGRLPGRNPDADIEHGLQQRAAEALEELAVDLAPDPGAPQWVGGRRIERDGHAVGTDQPRPANERAVLPALQFGIVFAVETAAARDKDARSIEAVNVALNERAHPAGPCGIERGFEHGGDDGPLRHRARGLLEPSCVDPGHRAGFCLRCRLCSRSDGRRGKCHRRFDRAEWLS